MTVQRFTPPRGYLCVGGPLDSQMTVKADGVRQFNIAIAPDFKLFSRDQMQGDVSDSIKVVTYTLTRTDDGGLIWQCTP